MKNWLNNDRLPILLDQMVFSGTGFLLTWQMARYLGATIFGTYSAYILVLYLIISALSAWTIQIFQVNQEYKKTYLTFVFWLHILLLITCISLFNLMAPWFNMAVDNKIIFFSIGYVIFDFGRKVLLIINKALLTLVLDIMLAILLLLVFYWVKWLDKKNLNDLLFYFSIAYGMMSFVIFLSIKPYFFSYRDSLHYVQTHFRQGRWLFSSALCQWWAGNMLVITSGLYLGVAALGALRLGQSLFGILNLVLQAYENYVLPNTAKIINMELEEGLAFVRKMNKGLAIIFIPTLVLIFLFSDQLMLILGGQAFLPYAMVLKGLSILYIFILLSQPIRFIIRSLHFNQHFFYGYLINLGFVSLSAHYLLTHFAIHGVIMGLISSQILLIIYWSIILYNKKISLWKLSTSY